MYKIEPEISMATEVLSEWFPCPKILFAMKYWQMAIHWVSGPETFIPYDIVFYGCLQNSSI